MKELMTKVFIEQPRLHRVCSMSPLTLSWAGTPIRSKHFLVEVAETNNDGADYMQDGDKPCEESFPCKKEGMCETNTPPRDPEDPDFDENDQAADCR